MNTKNNSSLTHQESIESCLKSASLNNLFNILFGKELTSNKKNNTPVFKSCPDLQINNKIQSEGLELISLFIPSVKSFFDANFKTDLASNSTNESTLINYFKCFANKGIYNPNIAKYLKKQLENNPREFFLETEKRCRDFLEKQDQYNKEWLIKILREQADIYTKYFDYDGLSDNNDTLDISMNKNMFYIYLNALEKDLPKLLSRVLLLAAFPIRHRLTENEKARFKIGTPPTFSPPTTESCLTQGMIGLILSTNKSIYTNDKADKLYTEYVYSVNNKTPHINRLIEAKKAISATTTHKSDIDFAYIKYLKSNNDVKAVFKELSVFPEKYPAHTDGLKLLAECYRDGLGCAIDAKKAKDLFHKAANLGNREAIICLADSYYAGNITLGIDRNNNEAKKWCEKAVNDESIPSLDFARLCYYLAEIELVQDNCDRGYIEQFLEKSRDKGYGPANQRLKALRRELRPISKVQIDFENRACNGKHICVINNKDLPNLIFANSLPDDWQVCVYEKNNMDTFVKERINAQNFPEQLLFVFFSDDESKNIQDAVMLLDLLYNKTIEIAKQANDNKKIDAFIQSIDIYLKANFNQAAMMADASLGDMGDDLFFKVHVCDPNRDAAHNLLMKAPLFIPCIKSKHENVNMVILGANDFAYQLVKETVATTYMVGHDVRINIIDSNVDKLENKLRLECPGLFNDNENNQIHFHHIDCCDYRIPKILSEIEFKGDFPNINVNINALKNANYFVVDIGTDLENIEYASKLRGWLLRYSANFDRYPFIAVHCQESRSANLAKRLNVGGKIAGEQYWNNYMLYCFGMWDSLYSFDTLHKNNLLEEIALNVHLSYYGDDKVNGERDYYLHSYSQDSSKATAVGLLYRLFSVGVGFGEENYEKYHNIKKEDLATFAKSFQDLLDDIIIERLAEAEQNRWNLFMGTRGYEYASNDEVEKYISVNNLSHRHELAKLHPFICDWQDFSEKHDSIFSQLCSRIGGKLAKPLKNPRATTIKSIKETSNILKI